MNTNAYHQPGVEAGKKAATAVLALQSKVLTVLRGSVGSPKAAAAIATQIGDADPEAVYHILAHLAANHANITKTTSANPSGDTFVMS